MRFREVTAVPSAVSHSTAPTRGRTLEWTLQAPSHSDSFLEGTFFYLHVPAFAAVAADPAAPNISGSAPK